jgi:putative transposase
MPKTTSPSYVLSLPLVVKPGEDRVMVGRLQAGQRLYNVVLQEALIRLDRMRQSKAWQAARAMSKGKARSDAFKAAQAQFGFNEYAMHGVATEHKNAAGFKDRLGAHETQKIATRAWKAVSEYAFGKRGKPRFKSRTRPLHSLEGKNNQAGIRWKSQAGGVEWNGLVLPARLSNSQQDPYPLEALKTETQYCRIIWRNIDGQRRWFVQLIQKGEAPAKYAFLAQGEPVGLDLGPSTIAIVGDHAAGLVRFAPSVEPPWAECRRLQRAMDRSRRATNPECSNPNGTYRKGTKIKVRSAGYKRRLQRRAETERRLAATRKKEHGELANTILGLGTLVKTEALSYKAFQKNYGRSVKVRAPGEFIDRLNRKAESAGGKLIELNSRCLRMSQYDHVLGQWEKKPLSQRWHRLGGANQWVQRDIYSAFLARNVEGDEHNPSRLDSDWAVQEPALRRAGLCLEQSASGTAPAVPTVAIPSERIARLRRLGRGLRPDAVAETREPVSPSSFALGTPWL